jgi:beta-phosphoglucomutase-like phosphatase (HAD superfamily)
MAFKLEIPDKPYAGVIFDNDGTLADSMPLHYQAWLETVRRQVAGFDWPVELFYSMAGMNVHETINRLNTIKGCELDPYQAEKDKLEIFERLAPQVQPITPVVNYARELKAKGIPIAVGTGAHRVDAILTLKAIGADDHLRRSRNPGRGQEWQTRPGNLAPLRPADGGRSEPMSCARRRRARH